MNPKTVAILGSTGSIGRQALDVIARYRDRFRVVALAAGGRVDELIAQCATFAPALVSVRDADAVATVRGALGGAVRVEHGHDGLAAVALESGADILVAATDGAVAFDAVFAAVERGIDVAIANKELIVAAGEQLVALAARSGARLLPVDSEHSALFQCLVGEPPERIASLVLTASGGPFWTWPVERIRTASVADALRHPTWQMGVKNTVDSATMMNKGLEVIEASKLFGLPAERVGVLVHRTSVAHGFAIFTDGNVKCQLAPPDMRLPIGYALAYPDRLEEHFARAAEPVDPLVALGAEAGAPGLTLAFERPDPERFPCLELAYEAIRRGGCAPAALSAANEIAVAAFVREQIPFGAIAGVVQAGMDAGSWPAGNLDTVRAADAVARVTAQEAVDAAGMATGGIRGKSA